jgi:hypothetical protein
MTPLLLMGLAVVLAVAVPDRLAHAGWVYRSPGLGVLAWQATMLTVVVSVVAAVESLVTPWHPARDAVCGLWQLCLDALTGAHGGHAQAVAWTGLALLARRPRPPDRAPST